MPKSKKHIRVEFLYDRTKNITSCYAWNGMELLDTLKMNGTLSAFTKEKVLQEMSKKHEG